MIRVSGQSKSRPVKAAGAEVSVLRRKQKLHAAVAKRTFASQNVQNTSCPEHFLKLRCRKLARRCGETHICKSMYKTLQVRSTFWSWDVEKLHAAVAKWTFVSENVQNTSASEHFLTFWSWHVEKLHAAVAKRTFASQNVQNTSCSEHFLKLRCPKNARWSSDVQKLHAAVAKRTCVCQNVLNTCVFAHFLKFRCRKSVS